MNPNGLEFKVIPNLAGLRNKSARNQRRLEKKKNNRK